MPLLIRVPKLDIGWPVIVLGGSSPVPGGVNREAVYLHQVKAALLQVANECFQLLAAIGAANHGKQEVALMAKVEHRLPGIVDKAGALDRQRVGGALCFAPNLHGA